ncbi:MAG TPA: tRNA-(ms[2]io[6]A)-hydroxylase [Myxococcota bacterium]|nr:tRNA-(ms[2]io[6]A)-hydroxylase [Myxococcota bacterium]
MLRLAAPTDPDWPERALAHLDEVLLDHAHLEKKAAGTAVALLFRYPERRELQAPLARLAREELAHFEAALGQLARRGVAFARQRAGGYAGRLHRVVRPDEPARRLDTLLVAALIEARSCERFGLLADALRGVDPELADFYAGLLAAEARHHGEYVELATVGFPAQQVRRRLEEVARHEAGVLAGLREPRLHG